MRGTLAGAAGYPGAVEALQDALVRTLSADGSVSVRVLSATNLVREAVRRHRTSPAASVALGRALMGGLLLATEAQDGERVQIQVRGDGPLGSLLVTADAGGAVRGYVQHPSADVPLRGEELGVAAGIGLGALSVERNHPSWKRPYSGIVPLVTGEIAQDLAHYLLESEQKPSAVALGVYLGRDGAIEAAGGYLIQSLPGASESALADLEARVSGTRHPSELLHAGASAESILERLVEGVGAGELSRVTPRFECPCSDERVRYAATLLGRDELRDAVRKGETLEVVCAFCAEVYRLAPDEIGALLPDA
jgi:molecular chaperone Hsp33